MAVMHISTIGNPEFINVKPYNPLISECEIKVFYLGENRNRSYISKEVAIEMANSLPGCPIVGQFKKDKQDFGDHGESVTIDGDGVHFNCLTTPYGFVAPNAKIWFQKFLETDEFGVSVEREYLMTTGFLWTGQFPECQSAIDSGKGQSMELDEETLNGNWTKKYNSFVEFFIINDALFSKLCILGDDVEPCFEGASVTAPQVSSTFSMDDKFKTTLFTMMRDLQDALEKGGQESMVKDFSETQDNFEKTVSAENEIHTEDTPDVTFAKKEEEEKEEKAPTSEEDKETPAKEEEKEDEEKKKGNFVKEEKEDEEKPEEEDKDDKEEDKEDEKKKFSLLEAEHQTLQTSYAELQTQFSALQAQFAELQSFKNQIEDEKKDTLINSFYMLSDEDKKDVIENKAKYSLDDIEAKLSVICVRKRVSFDLEEEKEAKEETPVTTFSFNEQDSSAPAWISAVRNTQKSRNI